MLLPCACAQQSDADTNQLTILRAQAEQGDPLAQFDLGQAYYSGKFGLATHYAEAIHWYLKAAAQNDVKAQHNLGVCYRDGQGVATNYVEAVKWFRKAAGQNYAMAQVNLGLCYDQGQGVAKDAVEGAKWYRKAAEQNLAPAQFDLGSCYYQGQGVAKNEVEALKWWRKAAEQNHAKAQVDLGVCYRDGQGVAKDEVEALNWFRQAAGQDFAPAQCNLAACYLYGQAVEKDEVEGYKWLLLAAAQGDESARKALPELEHPLTRKQVADGQKRAGDFKPPEVPSLDAQPGERYSKELADLLAKVETGNAQAQNELGEALYAGKRGVAKDAVAVVQWFRRAAEQNHPAAQSNLGVCYERGDGVAKYEVEAYKWDLLAAAQGDVKAKRNASMLELMKLKEQVAEGKRRAQAWLEQRKKAPTNN